MMNADDGYDSPVYYNNVYGHTLALLEQYRDIVPVDDEQPVGQTDGVHLDLGCGFGRIAEFVTDRLNRKYIGIDGALVGLHSLKARGFEAHQLFFGDYKETLSGLRTILASRRIASLSMIDVLEHLPNGDEILRVIRELIQDTNAPAVLSVPNVAHRDIGFKLALGQWDYTRTGLLDHTHVRLFSEASFVRTLQAAGLQWVDSNDVNATRSDQYFPPTHPGLAEGTTLHQLLVSLRAGVDDKCTTNQLIKLVVAGPRTAVRSYAEDEVRAPKRPFLSIITRTQGKRLHCLVEVLTSLAAQKDKDFEVLIVGHKLAAEQQKAVERVIEDCPAWLRSATRLVLVDDGNRTRPLNRGFEEAKGAYISILDDDDMPMGHWVSTFRTLAERAPGTVLRAIAARQDVQTVTIRGQRGVRAVGGLVPYPMHFDILHHLVANQTPPIALAFPRGVFHDLNMRFDETLTTTEDWDFLLRAAIVVGVSAEEKITSVYRWWTGRDESSRTDHDQREWDENYNTIRRKIDKLPIVLPAGAAPQLRELRTLFDVGPAVSSVPNEKAIYLKEIVRILTSRSWRYSAIMRLPRILRGRKDPRIEDCLDMTDSQLVQLLSRLQRSSSWKRTAVFRRLGAK